MKLMDTIIVLCFFFILSVIAFYYPSVTGTGE